MKKKMKGEDIWLNIWPQSLLHLHRSYVSCRNKCHVINSIRTHTCGTRTYWLMYFCHTFHAGTCATCYILSKCTLTSINWKIIFKSISTLYSSLTCTMHIRVVRFTYLTSAHFFPITNHYWPILHSLQSLAHIFCIWPIDIARYNSHHRRMHLMTKLRMRICLRHIQTCFHVPYISLIFFGLSSVPQ